MQRFIEPATLARIKNMPLIARQVAEGFLYGIQSSRQRGLGTEFSQYRSYQAGDPLSSIDWKLFARSDRYYVREAERESEISVCFVLDSSASMLQHSEIKNTDANSNYTPWSKFEYAQHLIAAMAYLAQAQGDLIAFANLDDSAVNYLPASNGNVHWQKMLIALQQTQCSGTFSSGQLIQQYLQTLRKPAMIFVLSDFFQLNDEITQLLSNLANSKTEVVAIRLTSNDELHFNYSGKVRFVDLESKQEVLVSASAIKKNYLQQLAAQQQLIEIELRQTSISLDTINIDQPLDYALYQYLQRRDKFRR